MAPRKTRLVAVATALIVVATAVVLVRLQDDGTTSGAASKEALKSTRDGSYRISVKRTRTPSEGEPEERTSKTTMTVRTTSRSSGDIRQVVSSGDDKTQVAWRAEGQYILSDNQEQLSQQCKWDPPVLAYRLPLRAEASWAVDTTCAAGSLSVQRKEQVRVTGKQRAKVGKQRVDAWVVERTGKLSYASLPGGEIVLALDTTVVDLFAPAHALVVSSTVRRTMTSRGGTLVSSTERVLQDLTPR